MRGVTDSMAARVRSASPVDLTTAADTLAAAFADYPWTRYVIPENGYVDRLRNLQRLYLRHAHRHGLVGVAGPADGVIALLPPDAPEPGTETVQEIIALHGDRVDRLTHSVSAPPAESPEAWQARPWRLETLGVHPARQGFGLGGALVRFGLGIAAQRGAREITLDTSDQRNVRFYEQFGFSIVAHSEWPGGPPVWSMRGRTSFAEQSD